MQHNAADRAPAQRLEAARSVRAALDADLAQHRLDADNGVRGADKLLADIRAKIILADREVAELEAAAHLAEKRAAIAVAKDAVAMRATQLAEFRRAAAARAAALTKLSTDFVPQFAKLFSEYAIETQRMVVAVPTGAALPVMNFDDENWLGDCATLLGRELWRIAYLAGTAKPPFAKPPKLSNADVKDMQPAAEMVEAAHAVVVREVVAQVAKLDRAALTAAGAVLPPLPEPPEIKLAAPQPAPAQSPKKIVPVENKPAAPTFDAFAISDADALAGLTGLDCARKCSAAGCSITGGACAHPNKGGLQEADRRRPKALARFNAACDLLGSRARVA